MASEIRYRILLAVIISSRRGSDPVRILTLLVILPFCTLDLLCAVERGRSNVPEPEGKK